MHTPISFISSVLAAVCSSVLTLTLYFGWAMVNAHRACPDLHQVRTPGQHLVLAHPHNVRLELVGDSRRRVGGGQHVPPADVDLVGEGDRDRLTRHCLLEVAVEGDDALDRAPATRRHNPDRIAATERAPDERAGEPPEVVVGPVHPLHRHPERPAREVVVDLDGLEVADEGRTVVPGRAARSVR